MRQYDGGRASVGDEEWPVSGRVGLELPQTHLHSELNGEAFPGKSPGHLLGRLPPATRNSSISFTGKCRYNGDCQDVEALRNTKVEHRAAPSTIMSTLRKHKQ